MSGDDRWTDGEVAAVAVALGILKEPGVDPRAIAVSARDILAAARRAGVAAPRTEAGLAQLRARVRDMLGLDADLAGPLTGYRLVPERRVARDVLYLQFFRESDGAWCYVPDEGGFNRNPDWLRPDGAPIARPSSLINVVCEFAEDRDQLLNFVRRWPRIEAYYDLQAGRRGRRFVTSLEPVVLVHPPARPDFDPKPAPIDEDWPEAAEGPAEMRPVGTLTLFACFVVGVALALARLIQLWSG